MPTCNGWVILRVTISESEGSPYDVDNVTIFHNASEARTNGRPAIETLIFNFLKHVSFGTVCHIVCHCMELTFPSCDHFHASSDSAVQDDSSFLSLICSMTAWQNAQKKSREATTFFPLFPLSGKKPLGNFPLSHFPTFPFSHFRSCHYIEYCISSTFFSDGNVSRQGTYAAMVSAVGQT
jgi:hypothetical protein